MSRRGKRVRLEQGIYEDATGYAVVAKRGRQQERRFPKSTTRQELRTERATLIDQLEAEVPNTGSFAADVRDFLATIGNVERRKDLARLLKTWTGIFGDQPRDAITTVMIDTQLAAWTGLPKFSKATRRNLRQALGQFYRKMNGKGGLNPVADAAPIKPVYDDPRGMPYSLIALILEQIHDDRPAKKDTTPPASWTKIRLRVMAFTGLPQAMLGRMQPRDVNLKKREMYVRPRRKGGGAPARTMKLTPAAVAAFRDLARTGPWKDRPNAWGKFSTSSMAKIWRKAVNKAQAEWARTHRATPWPGPADARAYDLRHSFGSLVYEKTGDQRAVSELLTHSTIEQSTRYTQSVASVRSQMAIAKVSEQLTVPADSRLAPGQKRQKTPHLSTAVQAKRSG